MNPIEPVWRNLKDDFAWLQFSDLNARQVYVGALLRTYEGPAIQALTRYADLVASFNALPYSKLPLNPSARCDRNIEPSFSERSGAAVFHWAYHD